jgi:hypothetical protein
MRVAHDQHVRRDLGNPDHRFKLRAGYVIFQQRNALDRRLLRCQETSVETTATMTDFFMASPSLPE